MAIETQISPQPPAAHGAAAPAPADSIRFAELDGGVVVIRVEGRGSFSNSVELKQLAERIALTHPGGGYRCVIDMDRCLTMDSTFMGVLASVGLRQRKDSGTKLAVVNANEQSARLMKTLGIDRLLDVHKPGDGTEAVGAAADAAAAGYAGAAGDEVAKVDRIIHMIEAHQTLCDADGANSVRFESVLKYLKESLEREG